jgi:Flp pilus assembly protein TadG
LDLSLGGQMGMTSKVQFLKRLLADTSGNVLPMAASTVVVMAAIVGGGVDMSRAYKVQNRLQNACDSGVLAGRRAVTTSGFDQNAKNQANRYFNVNFDQDQQGTKSTTFLLASDTPGNSIGGKASTQMPMLLMQMFGKGDMTLTASCSSTMGVGNSDITMVLDVTGSMGTTLGSGTRLTALKSSMKNFYSTVSTATQGTNARVRYSFVPFSTTVNVGQLLVNLNPDYIANTWTIQSRAPVMRTITEQVFDGWGTPVVTSSTSYGNTTDTSSTRINSPNYSSSSNCNAARPANTAWSNNGATTSGTSTTTNGAGQQVVNNWTGQPQKMRTYFCQKSGNRWYVYYYDSSRTFFTNNYETSSPVYKTVTREEFDRFDYRPVEYDVSTLKTFTAVSTNTGTNGAAVSSTWDGCIEERETVAADDISFTTLSGMTPSDAFDLDIDAAPDGSNAMKWAPLWRQVAYRRNTIAPSTSGTAATSYCVTKAQSLKAMTQSSFNTFADSLTAQGSTYLDIGMLWGARLSNPDGIWSDLVTDEPANGGNVSRHLIFMTDGFQEANTSIYSAYGIEAIDRRITNDGTSTQANTRHSLRFRAICDAIKAKGVRVWVIGFTSGLTSDLAYCASPSSSYTANDAAGLNTAFQEIAKQVGELRVLS